MGVQLHHLCNYSTLKVFHDSLLKDAVRQDIEEDLNLANLPSLLVYSDPQKICSVAST